MKFDVCKDCVRIPDCSSKKRCRNKGRVAFIVRAPVDLFDELEPLRDQGRYETRNDAVIDALQKAVNRLVKK